jgi:hypothetical protein
MRIPLYILFLRIPETAGIKWVNRFDLALKVTTMAQVEELVLNDPNQQQVINGKIFPKIYRLVTPESSLEECSAWLKSHQKQIEEDLEAHAALMFRDFPTKTPQTFHDFLLSLDWDFRVKYTGLYTRTHSQSHINH